MIEIRLGKIILPLLPETLEVKRSGSNATYHLNNLGEITLIKHPKQALITIESVFPARRSPYVVSDQLYRPKTYVEKFDQFFLSARPLRLVVTGNAYPLTILVTIESFDYKESGGEVGDLSYRLELKEYRTNKPKRVRVVHDTKQTKTKADTVRPVEREQPTTHVVVRGDTLWAIAKRYLGDGSQYKQIAAYNHIANPNQLQIGQVVKIQNENNPTHG